MEVLPKRSRWVWRKDDLFTGSCFLLFGSVRRGYSLTALISLEMQGFLQILKGFLPDMNKWQLGVAGRLVHQFCPKLECGFSDSSWISRRDFHPPPCEGWTTQKKDGIKLLTPIGAELQLNQHYSFQRFPKVSSSSCLLKRQFFSFFGV